MAAFFELIRVEGSSVSTKVKGVVQVVGHLKVPLAPTQPDEIIPWYLEASESHLIKGSYHNDTVFQHSFVAVPANHQVFATKTKKRHGNVVPISELSYQCFVA